jgi:hypothetical protein
MEIGCAVFFEHSVHALEDDVREGCVPHERQRLNLSRATTGRETLWSCILALDVDGVWLQTLSAGF